MKLGGVLTGRDAEEDFDVNDMNPGGVLTGGWVGKGVELGTRGTILLFTGGCVVN